MSSSLDATLIQASDGAELGQYAFPIVPAIGQYISIPELGWRGQVKRYISYEIVRVAWLVKQDDLASLVLYLALEATTSTGRRD